MPHRLFLQICRNNCDIVQCKGHFSTYKPPPSKGLILNEDQRKFEKHLKILGVAIPGILVGHLLTHYGYLEKTPEDDKKNV
ncbi:hypothetical protein JTE90_022194 [Oedothorax gibbosus]|uniref:Uncharacterized protein n=1 Tax=Oedothorax gibbosus TaxID=931172 RepID=A0AAV6VPP8_9ARAC|nr:hypothetical protein JTE90_022194 [Oedothorax gibbosus]